MEADYPRTNAVIEGEGEHNHQGEKKSVMKKVKDKAKKIKDNITKHGGHGNDHDHEEEDDEINEETVNVHGAPLKESGFISGTNLPKQTGLDLKTPAGLPKDPNLTADVYPNVEVGRGPTAVYDYGGTGGVVEPEGMIDHSLRNEVYGSKNPGVWEEMYDSNTRDEFHPEDRMAKLPDLHHSSNIRDEEGYTGVKDEVTRTSGPEKFGFPTSPDAMDLNEKTVKIGPLEDLEVDPHRPKDRAEEIPPSNYQSKVVDPTGQGGKEADVSPLVQRLGKLDVGDESGSQQRPFTGSHDQFAPLPESDVIPPSKNPESPKTLDPARPESMHRDTIAGKISSATSAIADKAVSAKNVVASKLGYGEAAATAVGGGGGGVESDKGVSVKEYWSEKLSPGEEDRALSEAITDAIRKKGYNKSEDPSSENTGSGPGVVGRVKGWLGMSSGTQTVDQDPQPGGDVPAGGLH